MTSPIPLRERLAGVIKSTIMRGDLVQLREVFDGLADAALLAVRDWLDSPETRVMIWDAMAEPEPVSEIHRRLLAAIDKELNQ